MTVAAYQTWGDDWIVDSDIHPYFKSPDTIYKYLPKAWSDHLRTYGDPAAGGPYLGKLAYPRFMPAAARRDAWPEDGPPGSDIGLIREQHLEPNNIRIGILEPLSNGYQSRNLGLGAALSQAVNEWQIAEFTEPEPRLKASIVVPQDDAAASVREIRRCAHNASYAQILLPSLTSELLGRQRYWPIYEAAAEADMPIGMHVGGTSNGPRTGTGWPSYYNEEHYLLSQSTQAQIVSLVLEGVFEVFPTLKIAAIEGGMAWVPATKVRLDRAWERMGSETPLLKRPPSEYIASNCFFTTQPIEEPENATEIVDIFRAVGERNIMFSTDYPHWDFDDPRYAVRAPLPDEMRRRLFRENALSFYRLKNIEKQDG